MYAQLSTQRGTAQAINRHMIERAWHEQVKAVDRWQWLAEHKFNKVVIEAAWDDMESATAYAMKLEALYREQCERRVYDDQGRWHLPEEEVK